MASGQSQQKTAGKRRWFKHSEAPVLDAMPSAALQTRPPMPARRWCRNCRRRLAVASGILLVTFAILGGAIILALGSGRLTAVARDQINRMAGDAVAVDLEGARLVWDGPGLVSGLVQGLHVANRANGAPLMTQGDVRFSLSLPSLIAGAPKVSALDLSKAEFRIPAVGGGGLPSVIGPDGLVDPKAISIGLDAIVGVLAARLAENPGIEVSVSESVIAGEGAGSLLAINMLALTQSDDGRADYKAELSSQGRVFSVSGTIARGGGAPVYSVNLSGYSFEQTLAPDPVTGAARSCTAIAAIDIATAPGSKSFDARLSDGACKLGRYGDYAMTATISGGLKDGSGIIEIGAGRFEVNRSHFAFEGAVTPARYADAAEADGKAYRYELVVNDAVLDPLDNAEGPMRLTSKLVGSFEPGANRLSIDQLLTDTGAGVVSGAASLLFGTASPAVYLAVSTPEIAVANFKRLWPRIAAPTPRGWVYKNLFGGVARNVRLELKLPPGKMGSRTPLEADQLSGQADLFGTRFDTIGEIPPIRDADASVRFDGRSVEINVAKGVTYSPTGRTADLNSAKLTVADFAQKPVMAALDLAISGKADAVAELAAARPINALAAFELSADDFSGSAKAAGNITFPLSKPAEGAPAIGYDVTLEAADLAIAKPVRGQQVSNAAGSLRVTPEAATLDIRADLSGLPARVRMTLPRDGSEPRDQQITATLDDKRREALLPGSSAYLKGPIEASIANASANGFDLSLNLADARITLPQMHWEKGRGIKADAKLRVERDGTTTRVSKLELRGAIRAKGGFRLEGGRLVSAELSSIRLNEGDDFSARIATKGKAVSVEVGGAQFDARALLRGLMPGQSAAQASGGGNVSIKGTFERLIGFNDEVLLGAAVRHVAGENGSIALSGAFAGGGTVQMSRVGGPSGTMAVSTDNAGAALRFADLYRRMVGGRLSLEFAPAKGGMSGVAAIRDFTVIGEPRLARLINDQAQGSASLNEVTKAGLDTSKVEFELAQGRLSVAGGAILLSDGVVRGRAMGASVEGIVIDAKGRMDLRGTFMPARGLNRIIGAIPIIGALLGSGTRNGLIGVTYQLVGEAREPRVYINPLSLIAPGVFRQIFE